LELITGVPIVYDLDATGKIISKQILPWFFRLLPDEQGHFMLSWIPRPTTDS
jgi:hypothetical protein